MKVKVILKEPAPNGMKEFTFSEQAILDDMEVGYVVLSNGCVSGGRIAEREYSFKDWSHIVYSWNAIERIEVTQ